MREAYPAVRAALEARAERAFERLVQAGSFVPRVRGCIRAQLGRGGPRLEETARRLHVSPATLRRRLAEEGTSFRDLLDALRAEEACRDVLDPRLDLTGIASRLGFAHPNGFYKAFRRWTGLSPREYRARHESR
jgi:AraC-like DNA-binding protein